MILVIFAIITSYFIGSYPTAYLVIRFFTGKNIFLSGDKNMGGSNAYYVSKSIFVFLIVALIDVLKGFFACALSSYLLNNAWIGVLVGGIFSTLGHNYSVFKNFRGGKGASTNGGALLYANPWLVITFLLVLIFEANIVGRILIFFNHSNEFVGVVVRTIVFVIVSLVFFPDYVLLVFFLQLLSITKYLTEKQWNK